MKLTAKKIAILNIVIALIFAAAIILASIYFPEKYPESMYVILAIWIIPSTILNYLGARKK